LAISQAIGNSGTINDVTFLKFDLVAQTNAFNFIFASNEYGTYHCGYSDMLAFILTDLTTDISQNLTAILGTTTPVSVINIRDSAHNTACPSINPTFFSTYNVGLPFSSTSMNMKGYTVPISVYANIVANNPSSIKMVLGDYQDTDFDSTFFIEGGSVNAGNIMCSSDLIKMVSYLYTNNNGTNDASELKITLGGFVHELNNNKTPKQIYSPFENSYLFPISYSDKPDLIQCN
jgi:hypothetical protein